MRRLFRAFSIPVAAAAILSACAAAPPRDLAGGSFPSPGRHFARGMAEFAAADKVRREKSPMPDMGGVFAWPPHEEVWLRHLRQAAADFREVLDRFPGSPEAPEARYMLGRINDHPQLNRFDEAVAEYRRVVSDYPSSPAAEKARKRIELIESIGR